MSGPEVKTDSDHPAHSNLYRTLDLLRLYEKDGSPVYFIVEGLGNVTSEDALDDSYTYDEHSCPTNYIQIEAILTPDSDDPHGVFEYVRSVWMPSAYREAKTNRHAVLRELFPETLGEVKEIEGVANAVRPKLPARNP